MSFFASGRDYRRENLKTRPTKYIPKSKKKAKSPKCSQCNKESVKVVMLNVNDKRYLCQYHLIAYEKRDYKVEKSYKHFKRASEV